MPAETRIFRRLTHTVNGLTAYILGTTYEAPALRINTTGYSQAGIRVWKRDEAGNETEITGGSPVAVVNIPADKGGTLTATWDCPQTSLASTDAIVVRLYFYSTSWILQRTWITEQLGASQLDAATWTVYHHFIFVIGVIYWAHATNTNSRIENFSWTPAVPPPAVGYSYSDGLICIQVI